MSRPILITGASGFLGAWIIPKLLAKGHEVVALDVAQNITRLAMVGGHARSRSSFLGNALGLPSVGREERRLRARAMEILAKGLAAYPGRK